MADDPVATAACREPTVTPEPVTVTHYRAGCACGWSLPYATPESAAHAAQQHVAVARHLERLQDQPSASDIP